MARSYTRNPRGTVTYSNSTMNAINSKASNGNVELVKTPVGTIPVYCLEKYPRKMTSETVKEMRELCEQGFTYAELSSRFDVSMSTVSNILSRRTWKNV